ncbi:MAG: methylenetetrahydrofolate reductase C-terminal domain-containing protein [Phycisphaerales bacterium]|nr:MAG: methylenetetrahydrofolate reductase C-terminal domain-containing protein [Phycisphaerales bacterium]
MPGKRLKSVLLDKSDFVVVAELTGGPGYNFGPIEKFLSAAREAGPRSIPAGFDFVGVTVPQNPGGVANIAPTDVLAKVSAAALLGPLDFIPHISCKDHNSDAIRSSLAGFRARNVESVLALTGDKPVSAHGVFELDSIGLLQLVARMNRESYLKAGSGRLEEVRPLFPGAVVSPFKYNEASLMQQYYKMLKKIRCGATFLVTQVGWDWRKSIELMRYLEENRITVPVIGNVYLLSTATPAPRLMYQGKLPGCFVSDAFFDKLRSETVEQHIERAAQQVAMYRAIGAAGVDVGGVRDYETFINILHSASQIGSDWEKHKQNVYWPGDKGFYLYDSKGTRVALSKPRKKLRKRCFNLMHRAILDPDHAGFKVFRRLMGCTKAMNGRGIAYKCFNTSERLFKYILFNCRECGDCYLPENFGYCTLGACEKGLDNPPCGDSTVDGLCGNNLDRFCVGDLVYKAAVAEPRGTKSLVERVNAPRNPALRYTSSILNYLFGKDHTRRCPLVPIGEAVLASKPDTKTVIQKLHESGEQAYSQEGGVLDYIRALIQNQVEEGAAYVAVNVDAAAQYDALLAARLIVEYVKLVRRWGKGVPICLDSSSDTVLTAGLREWYNTDQDVAPPLISSIRANTADTMLPLKRNYDFAFVALLTSDGAPPDTGRPRSPDCLHSLARQIYDKSVRQYGFKPEAIFFEPPALPLSEDTPDEPGVPGCTYLAFETIKKIKGDRAMKGVHCCLRITESAHGLRARRIGVCRAFVEKAMEYGLDSAFVDAGHHFGESPADKGLLELIDAYAKMDGSPGKAEKAETVMAGFCGGTKKPRPCPVGVAG